MDEQIVKESSRRSSHDVYEAPRVESVLTADDLAREVQYAGDGTVLLDV
jgi:hypothetical protein